MKAVDSREARLAIGECAGLVDDQLMAGLHFFEDGWVFDDDAQLCSNGNCPEDGDWNRDQQPARSRDHQYGNRALGLTAEVPTRQSNRNGNERAPRAQVIAEVLDLGMVLFRGMQHLHDLGVAKIAGHLRRANCEGDVAVDGTGEDANSWSFRNEEGFASKVRLVHAALTGDDNTIDWTNLMRKERQLVTYYDLVVRNDAWSCPGAVCRLRHPLRQGIEHGRVSPPSVALQRQTARQHQHDDCGYPVLTEDQRSDVGEKGKDIDAEVAFKRLLNEPDQQRQTRAGDRHPENSTKNRLIVQQKLHHKRRNHACGNVPGGGDMQYRTAEPSCDCTGLCQ